MPYVKISEDLRKMTIPSSEKVLGCVGDRNVRHVFFKMPRYCDDIDMSEFRIQVHYTNAEGTSDYSEVSERIVDDNSIIFGWVVARIACVSKGFVSVNIKLRSYDGAMIAKEFNSGIGRFEVKPAFTGNPYGDSLSDGYGNIIVVHTDDSE